MSESLSKKNYLVRFKSLYIEMKKTWKETGFKGLYRKYGFKLFFAFLIYYLVRDSILYLILPWLIAQKVLN
jgi:hypothetical protein